jgi:hypothetical protein
MVKCTKRQVRELRTALLSVGLASPAPLTPGLDMINGGPDPASCRQMNFDKQTNQ